MADPAKKADGVRRADDGEPLPPDLFPPEVVPDDPRGVDPAPLAAARVEVDPETGGDWPPRPIIETQALSASTTTDIAIVESDKAAAITEVQAAGVLAKQFPRDEDAALARVVKACRRPTFAERAQYKFPRGKKQDETGKWVPNYVTGPSVYLAREIAKLFGNYRIGAAIVHDAEDSRRIRGWAWDIETNTYHAQEAEFRKLVQRKSGGATAWVKPDERDLRELTNKHMAIAVRNCILQLIPQDVIDYALEVAAKTVRDRVKDDPERARKHVVSAFGLIPVSTDQLARYLGHPVAEATHEEIETLLGIYASIRDGNTTWGDVMEDRAGDNTVRGGIDPRDLAKRPEDAVKDPKK